MKRRSVLRTLPGFSTIALLSALLATALPQSAQAAVPPISDKHAGAIRAISGFAAEAPDRLGPALERIGFPSAAAPQEWTAYPVVRKLEFAYTAAEKGKPGGGTELLALLAQDLKVRHESVGSEPALKPLLTTPAKPPLVFQMADLPPPPKIVLPPSKRNAIAAISSYSEGGALGGPHGILQHYFDLPSATVYEILRTARTPEEALVMGLAFVPERQRDPALQKVVSRMDSVYESARGEKALDPWRTMRKPDIGLLVPDNPGPRAAEGGAAGGGFPGGGGGGFPGGGDSRNGANRSRSSGPEPPIGGGPSRAAAEWTPPATAGERYVRFTETRYPVESGRMFGTMVEMREGFGGVVLGNKVTSAGLPQPKQMIWMPHADKSGKSATGEIRILFADGTERFYGPVRAEDAYAAVLILKGMTGVKPWTKDEGVGLVSLDGRDERPRFLPDQRIVWEGRWDITLHPALARLNLGRDVLLCDAIPIDHDGMIDLVEANRGEKEAAALDDVLSEDINNWKITDAPLQVTAEGNRIVVMRAYNAAHPLSKDYRKKALLSMQGFERGDNRASEEFTDQFDSVVLDLVLSSNHYQRLNDFAAVFALYRWAASQNVPLLNAPSAPELLDPVPPSLILTSDRKFQLANYSTEADVLREFYGESNRRFDSIATAFPPALQRVSEQSAGIRTEIQTQQVSLAELEERMENLRLDFRALSLRLEEKIPAAQSKQRDQLLALEEGVEREIRDSSHDRSMSDSSSAGASSRLINLARTIDPQIEGQLKPVVDEYRRVGAELLSSEKTADANQLKIYREALLAMISEPEKYTAEYTRLQGAYGAALDELRGAVSKESAARDQWQKDPAHRVPELTALLVEFGTEELDSLRSGIIRTNPETARKDLTEAESALQSVTTDPRAAAYLKSVRATDALVLKLADARAAFTGLLDRRDAELTKQYPEWRTWWVLLTCSRHPSADHLDFGSTANR